MYMARKKLVQRVCWGIESHIKLSLNKAIQSQYTLSNIDTCEYLIPFLCTKLERIIAVHFTTYVPALFQVNSIVMHNIIRVILKNKKKESYRIKCNVHVKS